MDRSYLNREIQPIILDMSKKYPVVTVTGPRQSGKTTLVKHCFPHKPYVNLEFPDIRQYATDDPRGFLNQFANGAIIDEAQYCPLLFSYIQALVDEHGKMGEYILTGSQNFLLSSKISQSLAGRTSVLHLLPMTINEISLGKTKLNHNDYLLNGFYPKIYKDDIPPHTLYRDYLHTYIERDVREILNVQNLMLFQKFMKVIASRIASELNLNNICNEVGITHQTAKNWLSILETSYLIYLLPPYYENFGKRTVKSPKIYFTDTGLAAYLLDIQTKEQIRRDPLRGNLFENMVVMEFVKYYENHGRSPQIYFFQDSNKNEVDLIIKSGNHLIPIEIKSSETFSSHLLKGLKYFKETAPQNQEHLTLIFAGDASITSNVNGINIINYTNINLYLNKINNP